VTGGAPTALRDLHRALSRHRVLLAAGLAAGSVAAAVTALAPPAAPTTLVVVAARDLAPGAPLTGDDLRTLALPAGTAPAGALAAPASAVGRLVPGPVRAGEPLTDVRLLGPGLLPPGREVATPVRVAERATSALVAAGDVVDVLSAAPDGSAAAATVVTGVRVLSVPLADDDPGEGALLVLAATRPAAARLAAAAVTGRLSVVVHGR
jgi:Flp pilus assembly protein CpaB